MLLQQSLPGSKETLENRMLRSLLRILDCKQRKDNHFLSCQIREFKSILEEALLIARQNCCVDLTLEDFYLIEIDSKTGDVKNFFVNEQRLTSLFTHINTLKLTKNIYE